MSGPIGVKRMSDQLISEYGSNENVRFSDAVMYDREGNEVLCKCGKPAGSAIIGKEAMIAFCTECSPMHNYSANFVYRLPIASI